jgi:hypothetical protein
VNREKRAFDRAKYGDSGFPEPVRAFYGHWFVQLALGLVLLIVGINVLAEVLPLGIVLIVVGLGLLACARSNFKAERAD